MKHRNHRRPLITFGILCGATTCALAGAAESTAAATKSEADAFDQLWSYATLYKDSSNPYLQEFKLTGRLQADWYGVDADEGSAEDLVCRRARFGFKAKVFEQFTAHAEMEANISRHSSFYNRLTDAYVAWEPSKTFKITLGKQSIPYTYDGWTSSKELISVDRSMIGNNIWFPQEYIPGLSVSGQEGHWLYRAGVFTNGTASPEFGDFDATWIGSLGIGYDFSEALSADKAIVRFDYVYQDPTDISANDLFTRAHEHIFSLNGEYQQGAFGLAADVAATRGFATQSDLFGIMVMPSYYLIEDKLQAVLRYTYMSSDDNRGIRLNRYENEVTFGRGNEYQEAFAGLNYYFYGHKLKLQGGVQYANMEDDTNRGGDYNGWQGILGLRISW
jgi:phosphate-selective porin OprO/OprP